MFKRTLKHKSKQGKLGTHVIILSHLFYWLLVSSGVMDPVLTIGVVGDCRDWSSLSRLETGCLETRHDDCC